MTEKKKRKILIIDDDADRCDSLKDIFDAEGYEASCALDGASAIKLAGEKKFDVALTDLVMERIDGIDVLKALGQLSPGTLLCVMTGYPNDERVDQALSCGAVRIFTKPFDVKEMISFINRHDRRS